MRTMKSTRTRRAAAIFVSGLVALLVTGCSGSSDQAANTSYQDESSGSGDTAAATTYPLPPAEETAAADTQAASAGEALGFPASADADVAMETEAAAAGVPEASSRRAEAPAPPLSSYPAEPAPDIQSRDAGVNPTESTEFDRFSTFAMDVDTSSYTLSRALVQNGNLPSFDTVRTEEFINYFDQDYRGPKRGDTFAVHVDGSTAPFLASDQRILRVGVQAERIDRADRSPARLTFVIDTSGSMEEDNKLRLVQDALRKLVDNMRADDQIAIVQFSDDASIVLGPTPADQRRRILDAIEQLRPTNSTNAEAGLLLGYEVAERMRAYGSDRRSDRDNPPIDRVILASDGVANVGPNGPEAILSRIRESAERGIDLVTVGVGTSSYNDEMIERLADGGNGFSAYVDAPFEAERLFRDRLVSTLQTVARDAKIQVEFNPGEVASYRLLGYENRGVVDSDFRDDRVDAGEIGAGHSVTALYEVTLRRGSTDGELATVRLRWDDVRRGRVNETSKRVASNELSESLERADPRLELDLVVAGYAEVLRRGPWSRLTDLSQLALRAERLGERLGGDVDVREFVDLVRRAADLSSGRL